MVLRLAKQAELETVLALYRAAVGDPFCSWNDDYPTRAHVQFDFDTGALFVLEETATIIGAISLQAENEYDALPQWQVRQGARELGRLVIADSHRGKGLAAAAVEEMMRRLQQEGARAVHLLVAPYNVPALKTYAKLGFSAVGDEWIYDAVYRLMEKPL